MRFLMPHFPTDFELPDEWLADAGIVGFTPANVSYRCPAADLVIPLTDVEPPASISKPP